MTLSRAAQTREGHFPCVCVFTCVCVHTCPDCQRVHHSQGCPPHQTTLTDLWSSALAQFVRGIDSDWTRSAEPRSHWTTPWKLRTISGSRSQSFCVWYRHTSHRNVIGTQGDSSDITQQNVPLAHNNTQVNLNIRQHTLLCPIAPLWENIFWVSTEFGN